MMICQRLMDIVRSIKVVVAERVVNSQVSPMLLISFLKRSHSNSSVVGTGSVRQIPSPLSMNRRRKESWRGVPGGRYCSSKMEA